MRHLELFAGIGGFRRAMDLLTQDHIMDFHCVGYSEIDPQAVRHIVPIITQKPIMKSLWEILSPLQVKRRISPICPILTW